VIRIVLAGACALGALIGGVIGWLTYDGSFPDGPSLDRSP
jgi:hypothetical protein